MPRSRTAKLSERERRFVDAFMGDAAGNATKAARLAGYANTTAEKQASRLLGKVGVQRAIAARAQRQEAKTIADAMERDRTLSAIARDTSADAHDRIAAIREMNKCSGRHSIKHVLDVTETLSQIIAASRASRDAGENPIR